MAKNKLDSCNFPYLMITLLIDVPVIAWNVYIFCDGYKGLTKSQQTYFLKSADLSVCILLIIRSNRLKTKIQFHNLEFDTCSCSERYKCAQLSANLLETEN